jgi:hypothetical protein
LVSAIALAALAACKFAPSPAAIDAPRAIDGHPDTPPDALPDGLVAWWRFDTAPSGSGVVADASGHNNNGQCVGTCPTAGSGVATTALQFDTVARIDVPAAADLMTTTGLTVAAWVTYVGNSNYQCPVNKGFGNAGTDAWQLCITNQGVPSIFDDGGAFVQLASPAPESSWHHYAITWSDTTLALWMDGSAGSSVTVAPLTFDSRPVTLGADVDDPVANTSVAGLQGSIDDVRIYNRVLSAGEIAMLASAQ